MTLGGVAGNNTTFQNNPVVFNDTVSSLTVNAQSTAISGSGSYTLSAASIVEGAVTATTTATASVIGTFAVTGQAGGDGKAIVLGQSGSLVLTNSSVTPTYSSLAHLSSSQANSNTNLIFKTNTNAADTIISGSGNIFANPAAPTAGFKRYIGTNNIFTHPNSVPQISGSMGFSPTMNANIINNNSNAFTFRGPVSSSASLINHNLIAGGTINLGTAAATNFERANSGTNLFSNVINGSINATAYKTPLSASVQLAGNVIGGGVILNLDSSSVNLGTNNINGSLTVNNSYFPGTVTSVSSVVGINANTIGGTLTLYTSGSNTTFTGATRGLIASLNYGLSNVMSASFNGDNSSVNSVGLLGQSLIVYGNNSRQTGASAADWGSAFVGRWNAVNNNRAYTADTIFAVGTGTADATRKTGFLIDSGSNSYFEGTVSVSGSFAVTGSAYGNVIALSITANTASMDLSRGNYFTLTLADSATTHISASNVLPGMSATLVITTGTNSSASLAPTMLQPSGSAYSATNGSAKKDVLSIVSVASGVPYVVSTLNMI